MLLPQLIAMLALPVEAVSASHCLHLLATRQQCLMTWRHSVRLLSAFHFADPLSPWRCALCVCWRCALCVLLAVCIVCFVGGVHYVFCWRCALCVLLVVCIVRLLAVCIV